ncbi:hypothetical protein [Actinoplanes sp. URMC 104]|uniref:hypothetical protein n=1 Tax=Actinoplanes sp. URMC 104 TaxID=3423409 RepID=UPI003F1AB33E
MKRARTLIIAAVVIIVAAVAGIVWQQRDTEREAPAAIPVGPPVNPAVPDAKLLQDVLDINAYRTAGEKNFSYVPKNRPPDLLRMNAGGTGAQVADTYQFGTQKLSAVAVFTAAKDGSCTQVCVRPSTTVPGAQPAFGHVSVSFSGNVTGAPDLDEPATAAAKTFWAGTEFVPVAEAAWFTDLVTRAQQSTTS